MILGSNKAGARKPGDFGDFSNSEESGTIRNGSIIIVTATDVKRKYLDCLCGNLRVGAPTTFRKLGTNTPDPNEGSAMTLILPMVNPQQAIIVADRRLTSDGVLVTDESNKAFVFFTRDARLAVAYTGIARWGNFLTRRWLPVTLMESAPPDFLMGPSIERFKERATLDFAKLKVNKPSDKHLSIVFAGYCYSESPPRGYSFLVSNFEGSGEMQRPPGLSADEFTSFYYRDRRPAENDAGLLFPAGAAGAVKQEDYESLYTLVREKKPAQALVDKGIEMIRTAARSLSRKVIGEQCNSIVLPSNPEEEATGGYHSAKVSTRDYLPQIINARGDDSGVYCITEGWSEQRDANDKPLILSVPKVGRNQPCPCVSGLKYKKCHGRPQ